MIYTDNRPNFEQDSQRREELRNMALGDFDQFVTLCVAPTTPSMKRRGRREAARLMPYLGFCVNCGAQATDRHHKNSNTADNEEDNLVPLCKDCHKTAHGK